MKRLVSWLGGAVFILAIALFGINLAARPSEAQVKSVQVINTSNDSVANIIHSYVSDLRDDDPFVPVMTGVEAKSSNYSGITIKGTTYYYQLQPDQSFDPVSRGVVSMKSVKVLQVLKDGDFTIVVYTIPDGVNKNKASG